MTADQGDSTEWRDRGVASRELGNIDDALVALDRAIELDPNNTTAWVEKGRTLVALKRLNDAAGAYDEALRLAQNDATVINEMAATNRALDENRRSLDDGIEHIRVLLEDAYRFGNPAQADQQWLSRRFGTAFQLRDFKDADQLTDKVAELAWGSFIEDDYERTQILLTSVQQGIADFRNKGIEGLVVTVLGADLDQSRSVQTEIAVTNTGPVHARNVRLEFPDDVAVIDALKPIRELDAGHKVSVTSNLSSAKRRATVEVTCEDVDGKNYTLLSDIELPDTVGLREPADFVAERSELAEVTEAMRLQQESSYADVAKVRTLIDQLRHFGTIPIEEPEMLLTRSAASFARDEFSDAISLVQEARDMCESLKAAAKPDVTVSFAETRFKFNTWVTLDLIIANIGQAHAQNVRFSFSSGIDARNTQPVAELKSGEQATQLIRMTPVQEGIVPVDIEISCRDMDDVEHRSQLSIDIDVWSVDVDPGLQSDVDDIRLGFPQELLAYYSQAKRLGKGGFAQVFEATRINNDARVAVKIPLDPEDTEAIDTFRREMGNWERLKHENIVQLFNYGTLPLPFLEMELCESSLERVPLPVSPDQAATTLLEIARGLEYAHRKGIIHRDLKPSNVLMRGGTPKISDWGLSRLAAVGSTRTSDSFTPLYSAPEQHDPGVFGRVSERVDIFQLGILLYELASGVSPFDREGPLQVMMAVQKENPPDLASYDVDAPALDSILKKCLRKEQSERFQTVRELRSELVEFLRIEYSKSVYLSAEAQYLKALSFKRADIAMMSSEVGRMAEADDGLREAAELAREALPPKVADVTMDVVGAAMDLHSLCSEQRVRWGAVKEQHGILDGLLIMGGLVGMVKDNPELRSEFEVLDAIHKDNAILDEETTERLRSICRKMVKLLPAYVPA